MLPRREIDLPQDGENHWTVYDLRYGRLEVGGVWQLEDGQFRPHGDVMNHWTGPTVYPSLERALEPFVVMG